MIDANPALQVQAVCFTSQVAVVTPKPPIG
jgi:hypothetical protein